MVCGPSTKVIDAEFAFMGPTAFDLGLYLAHLIFAFVRHENSAEIRQTVLDAILGLWQSYADTRSELLASQVRGYATHCGCDEIAVERHAKGVAQLERYIA